MKNKIVAGIVVLILILGLVHVTINFAPVVFSEPGSARREVWQVVNVTNPMPYNTAVDLNVTVSSRSGVYIACTSGVTDYFNNSAYWQGLGYNSYWDWLNGTSTLIYHWGEMDWSVSNGSLTPTTYSAIQFWGPMYFDSGGGASYTTFMDSTYMADYNLTRLGDDPDLASQAYWQGNQIKMISSMMVPANATMNIVFKIVMTESGGYAFNIVTTPGVTVSPSMWNVGGLSTLLVPYDYATVQGAIDAASAGYTIVVYNETGHNGLYAEDLSIPDTKTNLEIRPYAGASVTIKGVQHHGVPGPAAAPNIGINASGVKIHGFTIEGPDYQAGYYATGMVIGAANVEVYDNSFKVTPGANGDEVSQAIQTWRYNNKPAVDISGLNIHNNTFSNLSAGAAGYEGIWLNLDTGTNNVTIWNNTFSGSIFRAITTERSNTVISGNVIVTDLAPDDPGEGGWQGINVMGANGYEPGDTHYVANVSVSGNTIKGSTSGRGFKYGIKLGYEDGSTMAAVNVANNTILMNEVGVWVKFSAAGVRIKWNNIVNNTLYGVQNTNVTQTTDASYNWWGNETGPYHSTLNPSGLGDNVSDYVVFKPWLIKAYPPLSPISVVHVNPSQVALQAPAMGTVFTVNVTIANVSMMYGFQFTLRWNSTLIDLTNPSTANRIPAVWGSNYIAQPSYNLAEGWYRLFEAGKSPAPPFNGTTTAASLVFRSKYDPLYPNSVTCGLTLESVNMSDPLARPILCLVQSGNYSCYSVRPKLLFMSAEYSAKKVPTEFDATVNVTNVVSLYSLDFVCSFNATLLNVLNISVYGFPGNPAVNIGWDNNVGYFHVSAVGISPPVNGSMWIARVRFKVQQGFPWNTETPTVSGTLDFTAHQLNTTGAPIDHDAISGTYVYRPVPGDLNMDGLVDIVDLLTVAGQFGTAPGIPYVPGDLNHDGVIDIFDIIFVARNFGRTEP